MDEPVNVTAHLPTEAGVRSFIDFSSTILYYVLLPVRKLVYITYVALSAIVNPVWAIVSFVLLPITHLASVLGYVAYLPFVLLSKLETLYTFFGTAIIIGLFAGTALHLMSSTTFSFLKLDDATPSKPQPLRTIAKYRKDRDAKKKTTSPDLVAPPGSEPPLSSSSTPFGSSSGLSSLGKSQRAVGASRGPVRREVLTSTIIEEDDTEESQSGT